MLGALVILYFGIEFLKGHNPFSKSADYYAVYDDVQGLQATASVSLSGMKVGQVSSVDLIPEQPGKVLVSFKLDKPVNITVGSTAAIEKDLLGTSTLIINLAPGTTYYESGDTIPGIIAAGLMSDVTDMLPQVTGLIPQIDSLLTNINNVISHPGLTNTLSNLETITRGISAVVNNVNTATRPLPRLVAEVDTLLNSVNAIAGNLNALSSSLANAPIDSTLQNINELSANLAKLSNSLNDPDSSLGQLVTSPELFDNLRSVTSNIDSLIVDIKRNPKRYISIKLL